jgi:hypothetical protein
MALYMFCKMFELFANEQEGIRKQIVRVKYHILKKLCVKILLNFWRIYIHEWMNTKLVSRKEKLLVKPFLSSMAIFI